MIKILFICHGNICRSPMAEFVMRDLIEKEHLTHKVQVASAAVSSEELGSPVYPPVQRLLNQHGIDCSGKRARTMTKADYADYDMLIGMEHGNLYRMQRICSADPDGKISLLLDYTDRPGDIADPWYSGDFAETWADVNLGCKGLLKHLQQKGLV